jgi:hypothetical protein
MQTFTLQTLSSIARHCVRKRLLSNAPSASSANLSNLDPGWNTNSNSTSATSDSGFISSTPTNSTSVTDSESDGELNQENGRGLLLGIDVDAHGASPPDLLDRIVEGMKRAKKCEATEWKERERGEDIGDAMVEFWEGGESEVGEGITEEDVVTEAMLLL